MHAITSIDIFKRISFLFSELFVGAVTFRFCWFLLLLFVCFQSYVISSARRISFIQFLFSFSQYFLSIFVLFSKQ